MGRVRGFTLVEVLVVFSIAAVLVALMVPALWRGREAADRTVGVTQMRRIGMGLVQYAQDQNGYLPGPLQVGQKARFEPGQTKQLATVLGPYFGVTNFTQPTLVKTFLPPAFVRAMKGRDLNQAHPFLLNIGPEVNGQRIAPFGNDAPGREAAPMKLVAVPTGFWMLTDADQQNPGVAGQPWAGNTPAKLVHPPERLGVFADGSVRGVPTSEIPAGRPPGPPGPPPPPPPRP